MLALANSIGSSDVYSAQCVSLTMVVEYSGTHESVDGRESGKILRRKKTLFQWEVRLVNREKTCLQLQCYISVCSKHGQKADSTAGHGLFDIQMVCIWSIMFMR